MLNSRHARRREAGGRHSTFLRCNESAGRGVSRRSGVGTRSSRERPAPRWLGVSSPARRRVDASWIARALRGEGAAAGHGSAWVSLGTTRALVESLPPRRPVVVECEADDDFLLGRILATDERFVDVHGIDASARWARHATRVNLEDITRLQFGDHDSRSFERHGAKWRAPRSAPRDRARLQPASPSPA